MTDRTQPEALRALAEAAKWTGKWYDAGCNTVYCTYDKEDSILHDEIAHPVPFGVSGYIAAAHPHAVIALLDRIAELEAQLEAVGAGGVSGPLIGRASLSANAGEPVAWRLTNTAYRKPKYEYFEHKSHAEVRQEQFNQSVDDGGLHNLTPLYTAPQPAPAPLSDDVVRDAARYRWLRATTNYVTSNGERIDVRNMPETWDVAIDAAIAAQGGK